MIREENCPMQTKKRAKSVTFGKKKVEKTTPSVELEEKPVVVVHSHKVEEETDVTESYPSDEKEFRKETHRVESHDDEPEDEEFVSVARREDDHDDNEHEDRDERDQHHEPVEEYKRDDYDKPSPREAGYDESDYDEEGNRITKDEDEDEKIEPAEDVLSKPFPSVHKDEEVQDGEEHPQIFGKQDDRYEDEEKDDRYHKEDRDSDDDRYVEEDDAPQDQSGEPSFKGFSLSPEERRKRRGTSNAGFFIIVTFLAFLFGLSGIIGFYYISKYQDLNITGFMSNFGAQPTPTLEPTEEPTPTEAPVDLEAYTIKVLNGSGITGEAAKTKTALIDAGFKVGTTGNADNSDYTQTVISVKKSVPEGYVKQLKEQLEKSYSVEPSVETLSDNPEGIDVVVTIGSMGAK